MRCPHHTITKNEYQNILFVYKNFVRSQKNLFSHKILVWSQKVCSFTKNFVRSQKILFVLKNFFFLNCVRIQKRWPSLSLRSNILLSGMNYSATGFELVLTRKMSFYVVTYYLPSGLFVIVSWIRLIVISSSVRKL